MNIISVNIPIIMSLIVGIWKFSYLGFCVFRRHSADTGYHG